MSRFEITLGLLAALGTIAVTALVGLGEPSRMPKASLGWDSRHVESGAQMFDQYCASCHGFNASGGVCPPLDATSGLHGGDIGPGVAWRLEELGWAPQQPYEYVYSVVAGGRTLSTRPDQYPGNRTADNPAEMSMPAWSQEFGGPLRPDQVRDLTEYIVAFRDAVPDDATPRPTEEPLPTETPTVPAIEAVATGTITATVSTAATAMTAVATPPGAAPASPTP
jgi:mono/diheme cytochrome c family protein